MNVAFTREPFRLDSVYIKSVFNLVGSKNFCHNPYKKACPGTGKLYACADQSQTAAWQVDSCINYAHSVTKKTSNEVQILTVVYEIDLGSGLRYGKATVSCL
jgi:hypothetical protein